MKDVTIKFLLFLPELLQSAIRSILHWQVADVFTINMSLLHETDMKI